jgi:hypothetical protein
MNKRQLRTALLVGVIAAFAAIGIYMFNAVAQDRPHDPFTEGALPADQVQQPPTTTPAAAPSTALSNVQTEGFDTQPAGWTAADSDAMADQKGNWASESGKLVAKAPDSGQQSFEDSIFLAPIATAARANIAVQVYPQGNQVVGIAFRSTKNGYYLFRVFRDGNNAPEHRQLQRYDAKTGLYTDLIGDKQGKGYELGRWQDLRVELDGDLITCFFDNEKVFEVHDSQYTGGQAGVYTLALGDVIFDNFTVALP